MSYISILYNHVTVYLVSFRTYSEMLIEYCKFSYPTCIWRPSTRGNPVGISWRSLVSVN